MSILLPQKPKNKQHNNTNCNNHHPSWQPSPTSNASCRNGRSLPGLTPAAAAATAARTLITARKAPTKSNSWIWRSTRMSFQPWGNKRWSNDHLRTHKYVVYRTTFTRIPRRDNYTTQNNTRWTRRQPCTCAYGIRCASQEKYDQN